MLDQIPIVYIVDGDVLIRECLERLIREGGWLPLVFASAQEFLSHPWRSCPSCVILDVMLPGLSGLDLQKRIADVRADIPVIFVAGCRDVRVIVRAMKAGAFDFLTKPFSEKALVEVIQSALGRSQAMQETALAIEGLRECYASLSRREREVMWLVVSGLMNKQVGGELGISEITVKSHRGRVMRKMKARSFAELVNMAARLRIEQQGLCSEMSKLPSGDTVFRYTTAESDNAALPTPL